MHESVGLIHSKTHVLFGLHYCETRIFKQTGISPAGEGWTVVNGNMMCLVAALACSGCILTTSSAGDLHGCTLSTVCSLPAAQGAILFAILFGNVAADF
jgi:hypothetical protein